MGEYEPNDSRNVTGAGNEMSGQQGAGQQGQGQQQQFDQSGGQMGGSGAGADGGLRQQLREHMDVIGADGAHVGTIDAIEGDRIKLTKADSGMGSHEGHHHYLPLALVAGIEGDRVRLSANGDVAWSMEQEKGEE